MSPAIAKTKLRLVALEKGLPPYDAQTRHKRDAAREQAPLSRVIKTLHRKLELLTVHSEDLLDLPARNLRKAVEDPAVWADANDRVVGAIQALEAVRGLLARKVPK